MRGILSSEIAGADFSDCALILMVFAIPQLMGGMRAIRKRMTQFPSQLSKRWGIPVLLASIGGHYHSDGSSVFPFRVKINGVYTGLSGIYTPAGPNIGPLSADVENLLISEVALGPRASPPDASIHLKMGSPLVLRVPNFLFLKKARRIYTQKLKEE